MTTVSPAPSAAPTNPSGTPAPRPPGFWRATWIVAALELRQRRRSRTLWILGAIWFVLIGIVTAVTWYMLSLTAEAMEQEIDAYPLFSLIVYFVLLFGSLVAPALSAGSISSERSGGTLATTQVTLISTGSILAGKALASWITGIAFLVVAAPFVIVSVALAQASVLQLFIAILALMLQIGLFTLMGVGLSALISSPLFAIVTAYLLVALLSIGTLIAFALATGTTTRYEDVEYQTYSEQYYEDLDACQEKLGYTEESYTECEESLPPECVTETMSIPIVSTDKFWWILAMNPYVTVGDMVYVQTDDYPRDLFGMIAYSVRTMQKPPAESQGWDDCGPSVRYTATYESPVATELKGTVPVWWIGVTLQLVIAGGLLWGGYRRLHTPAAKIPKGTRIA